MKHQLTVAACLLAFAGSAQFFEHRYGMPVTEEHVGSGQFTSFTGQGHIMCGERVTSGNLSELLLVRTEQNGRLVPGPYFKNRYNLFNPSTVVNYSIISSKVAELRDVNTVYGSNGAYGVVGVCEVDASTGQQAIYYALFDVTGAPVLAQTYFTSSPSQSFVVNAIRASDDRTSVYLCGMSFDGIQHYAVVMKLDIVTGAIIFANTYEVDTGTGSGEPEEAFDLIENPTTNELWVIGQRHVCLSTSDDGYIMRLDPVTGAMAGPWTDFYGDPNNPDSFKSIDRAAADDGGLYICGWSGASLTTRDHWVLKFDHTNDPPVWSTVIDYYKPSTNSWGADNVGLDILERVNTSGVPELYSMGRTKLGELGGTDIEIYKLNTGTGAVVNQYTHGNFRNDFPSSMHMNNTGAAFDGLAVYSMREHASLNYDLMIHKSYFSGQSPTPTGSQCDYDIVQRGENAGPGWLYDIESRIVDKFTSEVSEVREIDSILDFENCHAMTITGGSNALMLNNEMGISLNTQLLQTMENNAVLVVESDNAQTITTELRDVNGSILRRFGIADLMVGETTIPLDLTGLSLATGVYFILWSNGWETGTEKLVIR